MRFLQPPFIMDSEDELRGIIREGLAPSKNGPQSVIVVGAGMAGLVVASLLKQAGHQVEILESNTRVGGRCRTLHEPFSPGVYIEAGAMRIPNFHKLVFDYAAKFKLKMKPFRESSPQGILFCNERTLRQSEYDENPDALGYQLLENEAGKSAAELMGRALYPIYEELDELTELEWPDFLKKYDDYTLQTYLRTVVGLSSGAIEKIGVLTSLEGFMDMSLLEAVRMSGEHAPGTELFEVEGGTDRLAKAFLPELSSHIHYGCRVVKLTQSQAGVQVKYRKHPDCGDFVKEADRVVITAPFSVVRHMEFSPPLSSETRRLIRTMIYVPCTKVLMEFRSRFWEREGIEGGSSHTDLSLRNTYYPNHGIGDEGPAAILASYTWQHDSLRWDSLGEEERVKTALEQLARLHGDQVYDEFVCGVSQSWMLDRHAMGAFALFGVGQEAELTKLFEKPEGRIDFAGEHLSLSHGWIQGAIESGIRAALRV